MVVGNGMLANALIEFKNDDNIIIFASGVSNSLEQNDESYKRELQLLKSFKDEGKKLFYFSTCSIYDQSLFDTAYIKFKKQIEQYIISEYKKYVILRLPTMVGNSSNNNIFFNNIKNKLLNNETVNVFRHSTRYLFDVDDLKYVIRELIEYPSFVIDACFDNKESVLSIVQIMSEKLNSKSKINVVDKGYDLIIDNTAYKNIFYSNKNINFNKSAKEILYKYL